MRTITNLLSLDGRVYVFLAGDALTKRFLQDAEAEGFTFSDGAKPAERKSADIYAVNPDLTINYVNFVGHMIFACVDNVGGEALIRIDYGKYISGREDFVIKKA